ncbi:hypothetical protein [Acidianus sp. HS-5]|uniref:hypothetical protein n=1 Tax=Acidianus sp. HS-5 TaxID=2886040 RepID=UPI001F22956A|nr:hypothetical protein [Acidianus sp. HS-5]BDC18191.1 hypothetical protein HS5_10810 [Acidianus sp. HS-5]
MLICKQGIKDKDITLYDYGSFQIIRGNEEYFHSDGMTLDVSKIPLDILNKLFYTINKGIKYFFLDKYLLQYIPTFGYGNYLILKTEIKDNELNKKSLEFLEGKIGDDEYINYLMRYQGVNGEVVGEIDEFYALSNELKMPTYTQKELTQCKELDVRFEDKFVELFGVRFRIIDIPYFCIVSKYISLLQIINGKYKGNINTKEGEGIIYDEIGKIKNISSSLTRICGRFRLDTPENCIIGDGISFHTKDENEVSLLLYCLENLKTLRDIA